MVTGLGWYPRDLGQVSTLLQTPCVTLGNSLRGSFAQALIIHLGTQIRWPDFQNISASNVLISFENLAINITMGTVPLS